MNVHAFLVNDLQFFLFPLGLAGQRLTSRKENRKPWAYLLQLFTQGIWITWALSLGQGWATLSSWSYAVLYVWNYLEWKHPRVTAAVTAAVRRVKDPVAGFARSLVPHKEKETEVA